MIDLVKMFEKIKKQYPEMEKDPLVLEFQDAILSGPESEPMDEELDMEEGEMAPAKEPMKPSSEEELKKLLEGTEEDDEEEM